MSTRDRSTVTRKQQNTLLLCSPLTDATNKPCEVPKEAQKDESDDDVVALENDGEN